MQWPLDHERDFSQSFALAFWRWGDFFSIPDGMRLLHHECHPEPFDKLRINCVKGLPERFFATLRMTAPTGCCIMCTNVMPLVSNLLLLSCLMRPQRLCLLPTNHSERVSLFINELKRTKKCHVELAVFREIGLIMPGIAGFIAITNGVRGRSTFLIPTSDFHFAFSQQIFPWSDVNVARKGRTLRA